MTMPPPLAPLQPGQVSPLPSGIGLRAWGDWVAHLAKAVAQQHHTELLPLLRELLPEDGVALDVGAHAGQMAKLMASVASRGRIVALEPGPYALSILTRVRKAGRLPRTEIWPCGLSDAPGRLTLTQPLKRTGVGFGLSHLGEAGDPARPALRVEVPLTTLDDLAARLGLARLDFVKADVEGWEVPVLRGGRATLARFRPALLLELTEQAAARAGTHPRDAWEILAPLGYRAVALPDLRPVEGFAGDSDYLFRAAAPA